MADNKGYITQSCENGTVMISEDVISTIVENAIHEVEGVVGTSSKPGADIVDLIGKKAWGKGMKINIGDDNALSVECNIVIAYGQSVVDVATASQAAIISAIDSMTGIKTNAVNVNVCGIVR